MSTFQEDGFLSSPEHESLRRGEEEGEDPGDGDHQPRPPPHAARVHREQRVADHQVPVYGIYCMLLTLAFVIFSFTAKQHCNVLVFVVLCVRARDADVLLYEDRDFCKLYSTNYFENVS